MWLELWMVSMVLKHTNFVKCCNECTPTQFHKLELLIYYNRDSDCGRINAVMYCSGLLNWYSIIQSTTGRSWHPSQFAQKVSYFIGIY